MCALDIWSTDIGFPVDDAYMHKRYSVVDMYNCNCKRLRRQHRFEDRWLSHLAIILLPDRLHVLLETSALLEDLQVPIHEEILTFVILLVPRSVYSSDT